MGIWMGFDKKRESVIPPEVYVENDFVDGERVDITRGSKFSGGFRIALEELFKKNILNKTRSITTTQTGTSGSIKLCRLYINPGERLLVCRGCYVATGFIKSGSIVLEA
jgi:hypothetical protein